MIMTLVAIGLLNGCDLGWDFLKEGGGSGMGVPERKWAVKAVKW